MCGRLRQSELCGVVFDHVPAHQPAAPCSRRLKPYRKFPEETGNVCDDRYDGIPETPTSLSVILKALEKVRILDRQGLGSKEPPHCNEEQSGQQYQQGPKIPDGWPCPGGRKLRNDHQI